MKVDSNWFHLPFIAVCVAAGCGGTSASAERQQSSAAAIRTAEEVGAQEVPRASLHLQLAKEQLQHADKLSKEGDGTRANGLLERAQADAELAVALARNETEKREARDAEQRVRDAQNAAR